MNGVNGRRRIGFYEVKKDLGRNFVPARIELVAGDRSMEQLVTDMLIAVNAAMERIATQEVRVRVVFSVEYSISKEELKVLLRQSSPAKHLRLTSIAEDSLYVFAKA